MASSLQHLLATPPPEDPQERQALHDLARSLTLALETPKDAMHRIFWSAAQLPMTQVGVDLALFHTLASDRNRIFSIEDLSTPMTAEPALVHRVARYLGSFALLDEIPQKATNQPGYRANEMSIYLSTPGGESGVTHFLKTITPIFHAIPDTLRSDNYRNPHDALNTAFQKAHNTQNHAYSWIPSDPTLLTAFFTHLQSQRQDQVPWTSVFPLAEIALSPADLEAERPLMVDVGGGTGPQSLLLRSTGAKGRIILQDQPRVLSNASTSDLESANIEIMPYDFFTPQPVIGAKCYFLKNIIHDWPDEQCVKILKQILAVLAVDSLVIMQDCVLPDVGASWKQTQMDVQMMSALAAVERTVSQWNALMESAGLRIKEVFTLDGATGGSVVVAVKASTPVEG